jgi:hypothetical protein
MTPGHTSLTTPRPDADGENSDPRAAAFCSKLHPGLFHAVAYGSDVWRQDPLDVPTIHEPARRSLQAIVDQVCHPSGLPIGRMVLLLGDSGSGKTHLMRAFRNRVHAAHRGYCGYLQMTAFTDDYSRYVLNNLIESLDRPYYEPESEATGLTRLSNSLVAAIGPGMREILDHLPEDDGRQAALDRFVDEAANRVIADGRFHSVDVYLVQALLYLQSDEPRIKARVLKYLRCEGLTPQDRQFLGGIVPCTYADAPDRVLQRLGELMWALEGVPLVLCVDQLEDMFDMQDAPARFRRALATLCALTSRLPSAVVVLSCLSDYYAKVKEFLTRPTKDRVEGQRGPITLKESRESDEIAELIARRLRFLYQAAGAGFREDDPTFPIPAEAVRRMAGLRARDVLNACQAYRERCAAEERIVPFPFEHSIASSTPHATGIEQAWNEFRTTFSPVVPVEESELAGILAHSLERCGVELPAGRPLQADLDGRFVALEVSEPGARAERILVGVCNKGAQGGGLGRQVEEVMQRAEGVTAVLVRSTAYPINPKTVVVQAIFRLLTAGGRRVVVEDSDWRTMLAFEAFCRKHGQDALFDAWQRESRPLTSLRSLRTILGLDQPHVQPVGAGAGPLASDHRGSGDDR